MKITHIFTLVLSATFCLTANAAQGMKPGLWEHSFTVKSQSGKVEKVMADMKKQLATMPAEQRKMMEEMMAKQGLGLNEGDKKGVVKVCISKEQAEKLDIPADQSDHCKQEVVKRTSNSVQMKFTCTGKPTSDGTADFTLSSPTAYTGKAVVNLMTDGKPDRMNMDSKGKWLSVDCGDVKPMPTKK